MRGIRKTIVVRRRTGALLAVVMTALVSLGWADSWDAIRREAAKVQSIQAQFVQEKHLKILAAPLVSTGAFYFKGEASLRWEYSQPVRSVLLMDGGRTRRFVEADGEMVADDTIRLEGMQVVLKEIAGWLNGRFADNPAFEATLEPGRRILLTPRASGLAAIIQRIELTFDRQPGVISAVSIFESDEAYTRIQFNHARLNLPLEDRIFREL